jgi:signal transduction histidine kinase/DNA-binding response OmpR family regulator
MNESGNNDATLKLIASYAYKDRKGLSTVFRPGEGLVGQCALEKERIRITNVPEDYVKISSGLGEGTPLDIVVLPVLFEGEVKAVIELASFHQFSDIHLAFLEQLTESMGIVLNTIQATMRTEELLRKSQALAEELQSQQKELTQGNKRLEEQASTLQQSEELLRKQQEELQRANAELQEKARELASQNVEVENKNRQVELAKAALEEKAEQLALTSKYKSEFLANMSHELRTPLNSLLILAQMLAENSEGKLTPKQVKFAQTIYQSGMELLALINDILDLTKIESGMMGVDLEQAFLADIQDQLLRTFRHVADEKGIALEAEIASDAPRTIYTDSKRLQQILKNLLSNALKFTDTGKVNFKVERATSGWTADDPILSKAETVLAFEVADTGIGIPLDQQQIIFEPFRQADGTTARQYGGTGLGLSISRELARLLGGEIKVESRPGEGSTFILYLPANYVAPGPAQIRTRPAVPPANAKTEVAAPPPPVEREPIPSRPQSEPDLIAAAPPIQAFQRVDISDDRESIAPGDQVLLIVEDDPTFARILSDFAHERELKVVMALNGARGMQLAKEVNPVAITLDIRLPDMAGWMFLDRLKHDPETRHIPIHVISIDEDRRRGLSLGAKSYLEKSVDMQALTGMFDSIKRSIETHDRTLLLVMSKEEEKRHLIELIDGDAQTTFLSNGNEALEILRNTRFDCIVVDLVLADMSGIEFVRRLQEQRDGREMPVLIYTGPSPSPEVDEQIHKLAASGLVMGIRSVERLLEETSIFLHRVESSLPEDKRRMLEDARKKKDAWIAGGKVLLVDDDIRNLFALTSVMERHKLEVQHAESGQEAIDVLNREPDFDIVLMDIMMPKMDGYQTIGVIRENPALRRLPIIALTAKAMKGDREKCLEAGASDYLAKPVNTEQLLLAIRMWLHR